MNQIESYILTDAEQARLVSTKNLAAGGHESVDQLLVMLTDTSWVVRRSVVEALAQLGDAAVEPLVYLLRSKRDNEARIAAAVDALVYSRAKPELVILQMAENEDTAVVADALQILGRRRSEKSVPKLIEFTKHPDDVVAVAAVEALGRIGGRAAVEALIATIRSGSFFRTFPAIDILGRSGDRRVVEPLAELLKNSNYLPEAARALGRSGEKAALAPLVQLLKSPIDSVVRLTLLAIWDLRNRFNDRIGVDSGEIDEMLKAEINPEMVRRISRIVPVLDNDEVVAVCYMLGAIRSVESTSLLTAKLDAAPLVAEAAASALKKIGRESDQNLLVAIRDGNSARRKVLLPIVTRFSNIEDVAKCFDDQDPEVRALVCDTVARLGNTSFVEKIFNLLEDPNLRVVHAATSALQALGSRETRELASKYAISKNTSVRRAALRILAYFGDAIALQPILDALRDTDPRVREVAIQGLPYLEDPVAYTALCEVTKDPDNRTRALAVRALAQIAKPDEKTYSLLLKALTDSDAWVRYYACQSLGRLGYSAASQEIADLLHDEAGQVRVSAVEALSHLQSRLAHRALQQAALSDEPDVKRAALVGLGIMHRIEDLQIVLNAIGSTDVSTRLIALSAVISFQSPLVLGALGTAASDSDEQVRSAAIGFLASRSEIEATEILVELLKTEVAHEKARAALLVPQVSRSAGILTALESADEEVAPLLISVLLRSQRADSKRALLAAMKLNNIAARKAAASGIAANRDAEKIAALRDAAENDPDQGVREICTLLLNE